MRVWYFQITASFLIMAVCVKFQNIDSHYHAKIQSVAHFFFFFRFLIGGGSKIQRWQPSGRRKKKLNP